MYDADYGAERGAHQMYSHLPPVLPAFRATDNSTMPTMLLGRRGRRDADAISHPLVRTRPDRHPMARLVADFTARLPRVATVAVFISASLKISRTGDFRV